MRYLVAPEFVSFAAVKIGFAGMYDSGFDPYLDQLAASRFAKHAATTQLEAARQLVGSEMVL
jgi:hypothetical protein